jgi:hypothetical protein
MDLESPDDFVNGKYNIRNLVRPDRNDSRDYKDTPDLNDASFVSDNTDIIQNSIESKHDNNNNNNSNNNKNLEKKRNNKTENLAPQQSNKQVANPFY